MKTAKQIKDMIKYYESVAEILEGNRTQKVTKGRIASLKWVLED